jgi:hypothetical protein
VKIDDQLITVGTILAALKEKPLITKQKYCFKAILTLQIQHKTSKHSAK